MSVTRAEIPSSIFPCSQNQSFSRHRLNAPLRFVVVHHAQLRGVTGGEEIPGVLSVVAVNGELRHETQSAGCLCSEVSSTVTPTGVAISNSPHKSPSPTILHSAVTETESAT